MTCWEWKGNARDEGEAAARWVSELLGEPSRLVRFIGEAARLTALSQAHCGRCCLQLRSWYSKVADAVAGKGCKPACTPSRHDAALQGVTRWQPEVLAQYGKLYLLTCLQVCLAQMMLHQIPPTGGGPQCPLAGAECPAMRWPSVIVCRFC